MPRLSKRLLLAFVITTLLGACLHFLYVLLPNPVTAVLSPVNESLWEHGKLLFWPYLVAALYLTRKGERGGRGPWCCALLLMVALMLVISYFYHVVLGGQSLAFDLGLYVVVMAAGFVLPGVLHRPWLCEKTGLWVLLVAALGVVLVVFTFLPPDHILFADLGETNTWVGIAT